MNKTINLIFTLFFSNFIYAQNVGIGTILPNSSAILDVSASNRGLLLPRVSLSSTTDLSTILSPTNGLLVYNLSTAGSSPTNVISGYYYYTGLNWRRISEKGDSLGDMQYWNGSQWVILPAGTNGQTLSICNGVPIWGACNPTVNICSQIWMKKNLDVTSYRNGDAIPQVTDSTAWLNLTTGAWCWYNNDSATYGKLYNWYAVNDPRGLAPQGWHVPTDSEWSALSNCLDGDGVAGGKMKETGTIHWLSPNTGATNSSGFTGLPSGFRNFDGAFNNFGGVGNFWSSTESNTDFAWFRFLLFNSSSLDKYSLTKTYGFSVRCVKD